MENKENNICTITVSGDTKELYTLYKAQTSLIERLQEWHRRNYIQIDGPEAEKIADEFRVDTFKAFDSALQYIETLLKDTIIDNVAAYDGIL